MAVAAGFEPTALASVAWVHPVILALVWGQEITFCTRLPAGEIDRGTMDVPLGLPVSRRRVYLCESAVWLACGLRVIGAGLVGVLLGSLAVAPENRADPGRIVIVAANFYCLYLAVGGLSFLISSLSDRRGRAVAAAFGIVLASFLLNFLAQFWTPAGKVGFLSILSYYKPVVVLRDASWPIADMFVLTLLGGVLWLAGGLLFTRRDICTV